MSKIMTFCLSLTVTRIVLNSLFVQLQSLKLQVKIYCERQCANSEKKKKKEIHAQRVCREWKGQLGEKLTDANCPNAHIKQWKEI